MNFNSFEFGLICQSWLLFSDELETSIQCLCLYSNVIFTKLTHSAFEDYAKDTTSDKTQKNCDDETTEDNNKDLSQNSETGYYYK